MRKFLILLAAACLFATHQPLRAQSSTDAGDLFVNAYMAVQQAEKLEQESNFKAAMGKLQYAAKALDQVASKFPTWQPPMVDYRRKRTNEAIQRVQDKLAKFGPGKGGAIADTEPPLPVDDTKLIFSNPSEPAATAPAAPPPRTSGPKATAGGDPLQQVQQRMDMLQSALEKSQGDLANMEKEKAQLAKDLDAAVKAREAAEKKMQVLQTRSDRSEAALAEAAAKGDKSSEMVKALRADLEKTKQQIREIKIDGEAEAEFRAQLSDRLKAAQGKITTLTEQRNSAQKDSADVPAKIASIQKELESARKEKEEVMAKLAKTETQLATVVKQRDDAVQQLARMKEAQQHVDKLLTENTQLMAKLADAETSIKQFKAEGAEKDKKIASLTQEVQDVKKQLAAAQKQSADYQRQMADLQGKLEEKSKELAQVKSENALGAAERKKLQDENLLLRGIVLRQQKEQARRDATKKLVLGELDKLQIKSKSLLDQIEYLGQPIVKLTDKERALFKKPELQISETEIAMAAPKTEQPGKAPKEEPSLPERSPTIADAGPTEPGKTGEPAKMNEPGKNAEPAPETPKPAEVASGQAPEPKPAELPGAAEPKTSDVSAESKPEATAANNSVNIPPGGDKIASPTKANATRVPGDSSTGATGGNAMNVPPELLPFAKEAKDQFERGNYRDAEKIYEKMKAKAPNNLHVLSNLGVVYFRQGKLKLAEEVLKKATQIAPEDAFCHCTLGIVLYSTGKYDEAVNELTKALAINPKNATAHNYLGITASQKGWQDAALKELMTATALDPTYADANFNLAVVFATQQPPNKEDARKYYKRATELGAEPDQALEQLIK